MDLLQAAAHLITSPIDRHAAITMVVLVFLEESGLLLPVPSDFAVVLAGSQVGQGRLNPLLAFLLALGAAVLGASVLYAIARRGGRPLLRRFSGLLRLRPEHMARAEASVQRNAVKTIVIGRWVPGMRILTVLVAGSLAVPFRPFIVALTLSSAVYLGVLFALGAIAGPTVLDRLRVPQITWSLLLMLAILVGVIGLTVRAVRDQTRRRPAGERLANARRPEPGALAGVAALVETALALHVLFDLLRFAGPNLTGPTVDFFASRVAGSYLLEGTLLLYLFSGVF